MRGLTPAGEVLRIAEDLHAAEAITDPVERYKALDRIPGQLAALVAAIRVAQGDALIELLPGHSWRELAQLVEAPNYQNVQKLVAKAQAAQQ